MNCTPACACVSFGRLLHMFVIFLAGSPIASTHIHSCRSTAIHACFLSAPLYTLQAGAAAEQTPSFELSAVRCCCCCRGCLHNTHCRPVIA